MALRSPLILVDRGGMYVRPNSDPKRPKAEFSSALADTKRRVDGYFFTVTFTGVSPPVTVWILTSYNCNRKYNPHLEFGFNLKRRLYFRSERYGC